MRNHTPSTRRSVSVPLRGFRHESISFKLCGEVITIEVSVPLRGFRHERTTFRLRSECVIWLVSVPLRGFRHESKKYDSQVRLFVRRFPSPCGVLGMKVVKKITLHKNDLTEFPSPCGVLGMKEGTQRPRHLRTFGLVSVPLRGFRHERHSRQDCIVSCREKCFRPLAGF